MKIKNKEFRDPKGNLRKYSVYIDVMSGEKIKELIDLIEATMKSIGKDVERGSWKFFEDRCARDLNEDSSYAPYYVSEEEFMKCVVNGFVGDNCGSMTMRTTDNDRVGFTFRAYGLKKNKIVITVFDEMIDVLDEIIRNFV